MTFTVFRRHNQDNCESANRYEPGCGCHDIREDMPVVEVGESIQK
jgi:hypothetical protein